MNAIKFPHVKIRLVGEDGNAFAIMGRTTEAMKRAGCTMQEREEYRNAATSGDYDNLLRVTMETVDCDGDDEGGEE